MTQDDSIKRMQDAFKKFDKEYDNKKNTKDIVSKSVGQILAGACINSWIFQFVLWRFIQRDVPWYMDAWAGIFFMNKYFAWLLSALWIGTLVASYCGIDYPFFVLPLEK
jgi:hypothetical protein